MRITGYNIYLLVRHSFSVSVRKTDLKRIILSLMYWVPPQFDSLQTYRLAQLRLNDSIYGLFNLLGVILMYHYRDYLLENLSKMSKSYGFVTSRNEFESSEFRYNFVVLPDEEVIVQQAYCFAEHATFLSTSPRSFVLNSKHLSSVDRTELIMEAYIYSYVKAVFYGYEYISQPQGRVPSTSLLLAGHKRLFLDICNEFWKCDDGMGVSVLRSLTVTKDSLSMLKKFKHYDKFIGSTDEYVGTFPIYSYTLEKVLHELDQVYGVNMYSMEVPQFVANDVFGAYSPFANAYHVKDADEVMFLADLCNDFESFYCNIANCVTLNLSSEKQFLSKDTVFSRAAFRIDPVSMSKCATAISLLNLGHGRSYLSNEHGGGSSPSDPDPRDPNNGPSNDDNMPEDGPYRKKRRNGNGGGNPRKPFGGIRSEALIQIDNYITKEDILSELSGLEFDVDVAPLLDSYIRGKGFKGRKTVNNIVSSLRKLSDTPVGKSVLKTVGTMILEESLKNSFRGGRSSKAVYNSYNNIRNERTVINNRKSLLSIADRDK